MSEHSIVRKNLLTIPGYTPYCGRMDCPKGCPRAKYDVDKGQFVCDCGWISKLPEDFMVEYRKFRIDSQVCTKCGVTVKDRVMKYCGDGSDKDNEHRWKHPEYQ